MNKKIVVVGSSNTDMIIQVKHIPKPGETVIGGIFSMAPGGKGANQAVASARAGGEVFFIAKVGDDLFGKEAINGFRKDKIQVTNVSKDKKAPSGVALIFVDEKGANSIAVASGANNALLPKDIQRAKKSIASASIVLMQLETPVETVLEAAKIAFAHGVKVILNPAPARPLPNNLLKLISVLTPNETEAELLTGIPVRNEKDAGKAAKILSEKGIELVIITLGAKGAYVYSTNFCGVISGFKVKAVDTTAAGDTFNGALAVALSEKKCLKEAIRFANAAAALSVTKLGAQPSAPSRMEIEKLLNR